MTADGAVFKCITKIFLKKFPKVINNHGAKSGNPAGPS